MEMMPSFYKILMDLPPQLGLPQVFMEKYGEMLPRKVELRMALGCGTKWEVMVEKLEEEDGYFLTRGWSKFCQDVGLQIFELLVFCYVGNSTLEVSVYATSTLEKEFYPGALRCQIVLKEYRHYKAHVPKHFAEACGLCNRKKVWFEYVGGNRAQVTLTSWKGRMTFGSGWCDFLKANMLTTNKTYSLEFVPAENLIKVEPHHHHDHSK